MRGISAAESEVIRKAEPFTVRRHRGPQSVCSCARAAGSAAPALANCTPQDSRARRRGFDARRTIAFAASLALSDPAQIRDEQGDEIVGTAGVSARAVHARQSLEPFVTR